ncbi:MAG: DUF885 domain-containing protein [Acidobacteria bacterium]|nr:DUF885 domain-containing protein [Acidobacteriota bacterium]
MLCLAGCSTEKDPREFPALVDEFVYGSLALAPASATATGYHQHESVALDAQLDDWSEAGVERQRRFYRDINLRLDRFSAAKLAPEDQADRAVMKDQVELALLELDTIQDWRHKPTVYVELAGNALFSPFVFEYAPKAARYRHIVARLDRIPALMEQARKNLADAPEIWIQVAREENDGTIGLIDKPMREAAPAELRAEYDRAAAQAIGALKSFDEFLKNDLARRPADWRLGSEKYARKFRHALGTATPPAQLLAAAAAELKAVRKRMWDLALPLHHKFYPSHRDPVDLNLIVGETLTKIGARHSSPASYFADARRDLAEAREFVKKRNLLALPPRDNLQVIETPEFMRGIYSVGGFNSAPALEPQLGAFYWLTPIPKQWSKERVESKLREYNFYGLKLLTIHEAMPGHYVQLEYANDVQPKSRRLLRSVFGNGAYVEGWAVYVTETMLDEGYLDGSAELRLTFLKQQLRMIANTILDIRLQTMNMSDQEALDLMTAQCFQEQEEAAGKLRRAKLSATQLPTYYAGWRDWRRLRAQYQKQKGGDFRLAEFHERMLRPSALPLDVLARLTMGSPLPAL